MKPFTLKFRKALDLTIAPKQVALAIGIGALALVSTAAIIITRRP